MPEPTHTPSRRTLDGPKVLDFTWVLSGTYASMVLTVRRPPAP